MPRIWLLISLLLITFNTSATCYKVVAANVNATSAPAWNSYVTSGVTLNWGGSSDGTAGKFGGFINFINGIISPFTGLGDTFAESISPFTQYANTTPYDPELVFFRCQESTTITELYATNTLQQLSGQVLLSGFGPSVYQHRWQNVGTRLTNMSTGLYFDNTWKGRNIDPTTLDIEPGDRGYRLIKAKNLTSVKLELINTISNGGGGGEDIQQHPGGLLYNYTAALGYIAIKADGINIGANDVGQPVTNAGTQYWVGAISLYRDNIYLKRLPTCKILTHTPAVIFPKISSSILMSSSGVNYVSAPINVTHQCQNQPPSQVYNNSAIPLSGGTTTYNNIATSGVYQGNVSIGFKASAESTANAQALSLNVAGALDAPANGISPGITHLVDSNYGATNVAGGVGVQIYRDGQPLNFLTTYNSLNVYAFTNPNNPAQANYVNQAGWYSVHGPSTATLTSTPVNGLMTYSETFEARLVRLPGKTVTPGSFNAQAEVIIQLQ